MKGKRCIIVCLLLLHFGCFLGIGLVLYMQFETQQQLLTSVAAVTQRGAQNSRLLAQHMMQYAKQQSQMQQRMGGVGHARQAHLRCLRLQQVGKNLRQIQSEWRWQAAATPVMGGLIEDTLRLLTVEKENPADWTALITGVKALQQALHARSVSPYYPVLDALDKLNVQLDLWQQKITAAMRQAQPPIPLALPESAISQSESDSARPLLPWSWVAVKQQWPHWVNQIQHTWSRQWQVIHFPSNVQMGQHCVLLSGRFMPAITLAMHGVAESCLSKDEEKYQRSLRALSHIIRQWHPRDIQQKLVDNTGKQQLYCPTLQPIIMAIQNQVAVLEKVKFSSYELDFTDVNALFHTQWKSCAAT